MGALEDFSGQPIPESPQVAELLKACQDFAIELRGQADRFRKLAGGNRKILASGVFRPVEISDLESFEHAVSQLAFWEDVRSKLGMADFEHALDLIEAGVDGLLDALAANAGR